MPPDRMDWRTAYLRQAKADFAVLNLLLPLPEIPVCQLLHYLQMTTEKMAKGFLTPPGAPAYSHTHRAFVDFLRVARTRAEIRRACGFRSARQFHSYIDSLLPLAQEIEGLSPEGVEHPNPEYPWDDGTGWPVSPIDHAFPRLTFLQNPKMSKLLFLIESCFTIV